MSVSQVSKIWLDYHRAHSKQNTVRAYEFTIAKFNQNYADLNLTEVSTDDILGFMTKFTEGRKPQTKRIGFAHLTAFINFLRNNFDGDLQNPFYSPMYLLSLLNRLILRRNWARLIQKIYHVNPLVCSKCSGSMRIIAFIEDQQIVKKILKHLDLWHVKRKPPPRANGPPAEAFIIYDESSSPSADDYLIDANYPIETYF